MPLFQPMQVQIVKEEEERGCSLTESLASLSGGTKRLARSCCRGCVLPRPEQDTALNYSIKIYGQQQVSSPTTIIHVHVLSRERVKVTFMCCNTLEDPPGFALGPARFQSHSLYRCCLRAAICPFYVTSFA